MSTQWAREFYMDSLIQMWRERKQWMKNNIHNCVDWISEPSGKSLLGSDLDCFFFLVLAFWKLINVGNGNNVEINKCCLLAQSVTLEVTQYICIYTQIIIIKKRPNARSFESAEQRMKVCNRWKQVKLIVTVSWFYIVWLFGNRSVCVGQLNVNIKVISDWTIEAIATAPPHRSTTDGYCIQLTSRTNPSRASVRNEYIFFFPNDFHL